MMSRGIAAPVGPRRLPVSIGWAIKVLISMTSPRLARAGRLIRTRAIGLSTLGAGRQGHDDIGAVGPEAAIAEPGDRHDLLRVGEANPRRNYRLAGSRPEMERSDVGLRVLLVEDVDGGDVIGPADRAVDRDGQRHRIAVLDDRRQFELYLAALDRRFADQHADRFIHRSWSRGGWWRERRKTEAGGREQHQAV